MILVIDCETTGINSEEHAVVEVAAVPLVDVDTYILERWVTQTGASSLVAPGRRVPPEARAVHHLSDEDLRDAPKLPVAVANILMQLDRPGETIEVIAAHNAAFDKSFLGSFFDSSTPWLDTWRLSQHVWPDAPSFANMALYYWLNPGVQLGSGIPHRALFDANITAHLLYRMLQDALLADLLQLQSKPILQKTCRFGKHRGDPWRSVPRDYMKWLLRQDNPPFDEDVRHTARFYLDQQ